MICVRDKFVTLSGTCPGLCREVGVMDFGLHTVSVCVRQSTESNTSDLSSRVVVYRLYMSLVSSMLQSLRNVFVSDAVSFVGVHQQRMHQLVFVFLSLCSI